MKAQKPMATKYNQPLQNLTGLAMYAKIKEPGKSNNPKYDDAWEIDVLLDDTELKKAETMGHRIRENDKYKKFVEENGYVGYSGKYVTTKKSAKKAVGETIPGPDGAPFFKKTMDQFNQPVKENAAPPKVEDATGNVIPEDKVPLIGNGSKVNIVFALTPGTKAKGDWGSRLVILKILDLIAYVPVAQDDESKPTTGSFVFDPSADTSEAKPVKAKAKSKVDDMEDSIPF
jgi:hypothetical protein